MNALLEQTLKFLNTGKTIDDFESGFDVSVQLEKVTILFLNELRSIIDASYYDAIDRIINQESTFKSLV